MKLMGFKRNMIILSFVSLTACGSGSETGENNGTENNGGNNATATTEVVNVGFEWSFATSRLAALDEGIVVAGNVAEGIRVARLNSELEPVWAVDIAGLSAISDVDVDSEGRIVVLAQQGLDPGFVVRLNGDGTLDKSVTARGGYFQDMVILDDGGFMLNDGVRLDGDLNIVSRGTANGDRVAKVSDGYVFLSTRDLALGGRSSGALVRKADAQANLQWQTFSSPRPANYTPIGIRALPDGAILAAVSGDTNPGHTLVVAIFEPDGTHRATVQPAFSTLDRDGYSAPLQFGSGIDMLSDGSTTYASFVANSGALGSNVRTQITAKLGPDGMATGALFHGGGLAKLNNSLVVANATGKLIHTNTMTSECVGSPDIAGGVIESQTEFKSSDEVSGTAQTYELTEHTVTVTPVTLTFTPECS